MRLDSSVTEDSIREALTRDAAATWGGDRASALQPTINRFARSIWLIYQVQLEPLSEEPDQPAVGPRTRMD